MGRQKLRLEAKPFEVRKLELELGLVAEGDTAKLRQDRETGLKTCAFRKPKTPAKLPTGIGFPLDGVQALRAEHDAEVTQISQAAQE